MAQTTFVTALGPDEPDDGDSGRKMRGALIAALAQIRNDGFGWKVPSQSGNGSYFVSLEGMGQPEPYCSCPDFERRRRFCKHIVAVEILIKRREYDDGSGIETVKVRIQQPWPVYNRAQEDEGELFGVLLRELCDTAPEIPQATGRPRLPIGDTVYGMALKVYGMKSARRSKSDIRGAARDGRMSVVPSTSTTIRAFGRPEITPVLRELIQVSALPLTGVETTFAIDSTGFSTRSFDRWFDHKYGNAKKKVKWTKLHALCGVRTNIITVAEATAGPSADAKYMADFVRTTAENFPVLHVSADAAYSSKKNAHAVLDVGGQPWIPFKANTTMESVKRGKYDPEWERLFHIFALQGKEFDRRYHPRSNIETAFSMMKKKFGDKVLSRTPTARVNEVLTKVLCHNLSVLVNAMYALGVAPSFGRGRDLTMDTLALGW